MQAGAPCTAAVAREKETDNAGGQRRTVREGEKGVVGNTVLLMVGGDVSELFPAIGQSVLLVVMPRPMRYSLAHVW